MNWLAPKLSLRVAQKQILTPGLVQMVSVLALNRLELREMINQEIMANPVLDEVTEEGAAATDSYTDEAFLKKETEKVPETEAANPFDEFDFGSFFTQYLDAGSERAGAANAKTSNAPPSINSFPRRRTSRTISPGNSASASAPKPCARSPKASSAISTRMATSLPPSKNSRSPETIPWKT